MKESLVSELEDIVEVVTDRVVDIVTQAIGTMTDDGRPFNVGRLTPDEELEEYLKLRNSPDAMYRYMAGKAEGFIETLKTNGLDPDSINSLHPYSIAITKSLNWFYEMEKRLEKRNAVPA